MSLIDYLRPKKNTASLARDRLKVIIAHERRAKHGPEYLSALKTDILKAIRKYVEISDDAVRVHVEREGNLDMLELNITLPDSTEEQ